MAFFSCFDLCPTATAIKQTIYGTRFTGNAVKFLVVKPNIRFARLTFLIAGIYGVIVIVPGFFGEQMAGKQFPPVINHPEYYYGFFGVALAWQIAFLIVAGSPLKLRPLMPVAVLEKLGYAIVIAVLFALGRIPLPMAVFGCVDFVFGIFFTLAYFKLGKEEQALAQAH